MSSTTRTQICSTEGKSKWNERIKNNIPNLRKKIQFVKCKDIIYKTMKPPQI